MCLRFLFQVESGTGEALSACLRRLGGSSRRIVTREGSPPPAQPSPGLRRRRGARSGSRSWARRRCRRRGSGLASGVSEGVVEVEVEADDPAAASWPLPASATAIGVGSARLPHGRERRAGARSEEHTSELQSRENLVCRLLLEKKKKRSRGRVGGKRGKECCRGPG